MAGIIAGAQNFTPITQQTNTGNASPNYLAATNDSSVVPKNMFNDYQNFWKNTPVGGSADFAGGKLTRSNSNGASADESTGVWTGANGQQASMGAYSNLSDIANNNPAIAAHWKQQYGFDTGAAPGTNTGIPAAASVASGTVPAASTNPATSTSPPVTTTTTPVTTGVPSSGIIAGNQSPIANMQNDYSNYWKNNAVGSTIDWAGGKLTRTGDGTSTFTGPDGKTEQMTPQSSLSDLAKGNGSVADQWKSQYGFNGDGNNMPSTSAASSTNASQLGNPNQWNVNSAQTTSGQLQKLIDPNSAMAQSWMHAGANDAAARGFTGNSTIRDTAMMDSLIRNATPIAQSDAAINAKAAGYNADMPNQFAMTNVGANNQLNLTNVSANNQKLIAGMNNESQQIVSRAHDANAVLLQNDTGAQAAYNSFVGAVAQINQNDKLIGPDAKANAVEAQRLIFNEAIAARTKANPNLGISQSHIGVLTPAQQKIKDDTDHAAAVKVTNGKDVSGMLNDFSTPNQQPIAQNGNGT